jgi:hypothetical protein
VVKKMFLLPDRILTRRGDGAVVHKKRTCGGEGPSNMEIAATILLIVFVVVIVGLMGLL